VLKSHEEFRYSKARQIAAAGIPSLAPEIVEDVLKPLAVADFDLMHAIGMADRVTAALFPPNGPVLFDPLEGRRQVGQARRPRYSCEATVRALRPLRPL
jgi:hypothetical protein